MTSSANNELIPLCVDLDGTIIATDSLLESVLIALKKNPLLLAIMPFWILKGKTFFKNKIACIVLPNPVSMPYRIDVINYLQSEKEKGRPIVLATATVQSIADSVANHLGLFSEVLGSSKTFNLRASNKLSKLIELYGEKGFDYVGDSKADFSVWQGARKALAVNSSKRFISKVKSITEIEKVFTNSNSTFKLLLKEIRVYQWVKNLLIFLPLLMAHKMLFADMDFKALMAFLSFSLTASFVYVLNDLLDLEADRHHPRKCNRPLASGNLSIKIGLIITPVLLLSGLAISFFLLPVEFTYILLMYLLLTSCYTFYLKRIYILDTIILAGLYTIRLIAGAYGVGVEASPWLLTFSIFLFFSLAIVKRYTELKVLLEQNKKSTKDRGYLVDDISLLLNIGPASGYIAVLVFILYVNSADVMRLYHTPILLLPVAVCILYWITRIWFMAHRGKMTDDPIVFTGKDIVSYILGIIVILLVVGAKLWN